jgi:hypothetical protein
MDTEEFRKRGKEMVDYICDYLDTIDTRRVTPEVQPGYLSQILPSRAPKKGEEWEEVMKDIERAIMPGVSLTFLITQRCSLAVFVSLAHVYTCNCINSTHLLYIQGV